MRTIAVVTAALAALPAAFLAVRAIDPVVPYEWRLVWRLAAVIGIPAVACGMAYRWAVGRPGPSPERCPVCGAPVNDPTEPNCLECGHPRGGAS